MAWCTALINAVGTCLGSRVWAAWIQSRIRSFSLPNKSKNYQKFIESENIAVPDLPVHSKLSAVKAVFKKNDEFILYSDKSSKKACLLFNLDNDEYVNLELFQDDTISFDDNKNLKIITTDYSDMPFSAVEYYTYRYKKNGGKLPLFTYPPKNVLY